MNQADFLKNITAAQKLCSPSGERLIESKRGTAPQSKAEVDPESFGGVSAMDDKWDRMFLSEAAYTDNSPSTVAVPAKAKAPVLTQQSINKSRVPDFIKKSMMTEAIDTTSLSPNPLDRMDLSSLEKEEVRPRQMVSEGLTVPTQVITPSGIDYSIIKAIINECLDTKLKEVGLTKQNLNENTLKTIHLKGGAIKLVDNSGNIYSAQLEKKGNINDNKK